ncbi:MAG: hypothetical protein RLZZ385_1098 [Pseudomonadota bacterium]
MVFLSPLFLIGLLAAAIPIAIHLIRKEKPPKLMFSTIRFLKKTSKKLVLFQQIQQWLLLLLRAALIALLVFAFARPLFNQSISRLLDTAPQSVVILLDNSMSMAYGERFEEAKEAALEVIDSLSAGDEAALVVFSGGVDSLLELTSDLDSLRASVRNLEQPGFGLTRYLPNLRLADQMLAASRFDNREIYLISDYQQTGLTDAEPGWKLAPGVRFNGIDVGEQESTNLVLTDVRSPEQLLENTGPQAVLARVRSTGTVYRSQAEVSLRVDDNVVDRQAADLANASEAVVTLDATFETAGSYVGRVTVSGDEFDLDNDFFFTVDVSPRIRVLVVNGEASPNWYDDEAHWFALAVNAAEQSPFAATTVATSGLNAGVLQDTDVVVLLNVGDLSPAQAAAVDAYVNQGGGLLIAPGDRVDPQQFNQLLNRVSPASLEAPGPMADDYLVIADLDRRHPILRPLTSDWTARYQDYWALTPNADAAVLMRFDNTLPALVERTVGEGRSIVFASSMDLEWNNLALQGIFLPLVHETLRYLVQPPLRQRAYDVGQVIDLNLDDEGDVTLVGPGGQEARFDRGSGLLYPDRPGIYRATIEGEARAYAVNTLPEESNLARITVGSIHDDIINPDTNPIPSRTVRTAQLIAELEQPQRIWWWIIGLVMLLLLLEAQIANRTYR